MQRVPDPYRVLGVSREATMAEVKAAHRRLAKRFHPDAPHADAVRFLAAQDAYELLRDPLRRREWDRKHAPGPVRAGSSSTTPRRGRTTAGDAPDGGGTPASPRSRRRPAGVDTTFGPNDRPPQADSWTWTAEGVPWWEDGGSPKTRRPSRRRSAAGADRPGPTAAGPSGTRSARANSADDADGAKPVDRARRSPTRATAEPAPEARNEFDVFSRSSGAAWSSASRRLFPPPRGRHAEWRRQPEHAALDDAGRCAATAQVRDAYASGSETRSTRLGAGRSHSRGAAFEGPPASFAREATAGHTVGAGSDGPAARDEPSHRSRPGGHPQAGRAVTGEPLAAPDLLRSVGLVVDGPAAWGTRVRSSRPGVYVIELPSAPDSAPVDFDAIGRWLERVPGLTIDGAQPTGRELAARLHRFWLPGQPVLYIGMSAVSIGARLDAFARTPLGDRKPHAGGYWLKALSGLEQLRVWWAETDAAEEYQDALLDAFGAGVPTAEVATLPETSVVLPFANLQAPDGRRKEHGVKGALAAEEPAGPVTPAERLAAAAKPARRPARGILRSDGVLGDPPPRRRLPPRSGNAGQRSRCAATGDTCHRDRPGRHAGGTPPAHDVRTARDRGPHQGRPRAGRPAREFGVPGGPTGAVVR